MSEQTRELLELTNFDDSLYLIGGRDNCPQGSLRIGKGQNAIKTGTMRSRAGMSRLLGGNTNMISMFSLLTGEEYQRYSLSEVGNFYFNGEIITMPDYITIVSGQQASFQSAIPWDLSTDYVFTCGTGTPFKMDESGNVTNWGIVEPTDGMSAELSPIIDEVIDYMASDAGWSNSAGTLSTDDDNYTQNSGSGGSVKMVLGTGKSVFILSKTNSVDLSGTSEPSLDVDIISVDIKVDQPQGMRDIVVEFDLGTGYTTDFYTISLPMANIIAANNYVQSTNDLGQVDSLVNNFLSNPGFVPTPAIKSSLMADYYTGIQNYYANYPYSKQTAPKHLKPSQKSLQSFAIALAGAVASGTNQWWTLRLPKMCFTRIGKNTALDWSSVTGYQFKFQNLSTNVNVTLNIDNMLLIGGSGLYGQYQYVTTFNNSVTDYHSNPNPTPTTIANVFRSAVALSDIPISSDPQCDSRTIWRTVGNGGIFYPAFTIPDNVTTAAIDNVSDFIGLTAGDTVDSLSGISVVNSWDYQADIGVSSYAAIDTSTGTQAVVGNVYVAFITAADSSDTVNIATLSGWTKVVEWQNQAGNMASGIYYKVVASGDIGATYDFLSTGGSGTPAWSGSITCLAGAAAIAPQVVGATAIGDSAEITNPAVTTVQNYGMAISFMSAVGPTGGPIATPSLFTQLISETSSSATKPIQTTSYYNGQDEGTTIGPVGAAAPASGYWTGVTLVIAAVGASGTPYIPQSWTQQTSGNIAVAINTSTGIQEQPGDFLMICVAFENTTGVGLSVAQPTGGSGGSWITVGVWQSTFNNDFYVAVFSKLWASGDTGATFTVSLPSDTANWTGTASILRNCYTGIPTPVSVASDEGIGSGPVPVYDTFTSTLDNQMTLLFGATYNGGITTSTPPTGYTDALNISSSSSFCGLELSSAPGPALTGTVVGPLTGTISPTNLWMTLAMSINGFNIAGGATLIATGSLGLEALQQFSILPTPTISQCLSFQGTMFTLGDTANPSRIYYSSVGQQEGVAGYYDLGGDDTIGMAIFNNNAYLFTVSGVYLANDLTQSPAFPVWTFDQVLNVPGCTSAQSIQSTDVGIMYESPDGLRLFNGYEATLVATQILPLFRGESAETYIPITNVYASMLAREEYWFSQGTANAPCYALTFKALTNLQDVPEFLIRDTGYTGVTAMEYEEYGKNIVASIARTPTPFGFVTLDTYGQFNDGTLDTISIDWLPQCFYSGLQFVYKVQRVFIDINTQGATLSVNLITDSGAILSPITISNTTRSIFELTWGGISTHVVGVEIFGSLQTGTSQTLPVELFRVGIEVDKATTGS